MSKRIIPLFLSVVILFSAFSPISASADYTNSREYASYWDNCLVRFTKSLSDGNWGGLIQGLTGLVCEDICRTSDDTLHHADSIKGCKTGSDNKGMYALAKCKYCGQSLKYYSNDLKRQYNDAVTSRGGGFGRVTKGGGFITSSAHKTVRILGQPHYWCKHGSSSILPESVGTLSCACPYYFRSANSSGLRNLWGMIADFEFTCNVDGVYSLGTYSASCYAMNTAGAKITGTVKISSDCSESKVFYAGDVITVSVMGTFTSGTYVTSVLDAPEPELKITPLESIEKDYPKTSRPGIINGDFTYTVNNTTNKVENTTIVDETNNTFYNPVTNTTTNMNDWVFDYSDRSYTITTDNSTTTTVTYGDEYVTIKEGDTISCRPL